MKTKSSINRMLKYASKKEGSLIPICVVYTLIAVIFPFFAVALPKLLISILTSTSPTSRDVCLLILIYFGFAAVFGFLKTFINNSSYVLMTKLRIDLVRDEAVKLMTMDYSYCEDNSFQDEYEKGLQACGSNMNGVEGVYHKLFALPAILILVLLLSVFIGLKSIGILVAVLLHVAVTTAITIYISKFRFSKKETLSHYSRRVGYYQNTVSDFTYGKDIRLFDLKSRIQRNYNSEISGYTAAITTIKNKEYALGLITLFTLLLSDAASYGLLTYMVVNGLSIADFSMYLVAISTLSLQLTELSTTITFINNEMLYVNDFYRFIDTNFITTGGDKKAVSKSDTLEIEFKNVSFKYPKTETNIFTNLNMKINKGERLAIVGVNGAGKTTFVKLLTGLFKIDEGQILINGVDINDYKKSELYSMFAVVFQDVNLLAFTVAQNIASSEKNVDTEKVKQALEKVGLDKKISTLKNGQDHMVLKVIEADGAEFSGGEAQKMTIARALYKDACMVIMDEPTSALDALAEAEIYESFSDLVKGKTALYISHRLASTKFCDRIIVFDGTSGTHIAEQGTHEELMKLNGQYYDMFVTQGKYYNTDTSETEAGGIN